MLKHKFLSLLLLTILGCKATWNGSLSSSLAIPFDKYHVVGPVSGESRTFVFLYLFGGIDHQNLVLEAKTKLLRTHTLDSNQVFGDWSVSFKSLHTLFGLQQICRVSANVISLVPIKKGGEIEPKNTGLDKPKFPSEAQNESFAGKSPAKGDRVKFELDGQKFEGTVIKMSPNTVKIEYLDPTSQTVKKTNKFLKDIKVIKP
jgi:hypothetical protein